MSLLSPAEFEAALRAIGARRYHSLHPFHHMLHTGKLNRLQVQAWALNRYIYQSRIPIKDAIIVSRLPTPELRATWRTRIEDHDGSDGSDGGIARWLLSNTASAISPNRTRSANAGTGNNAGRRTARPSALVKSRFVTGFGDTQR